ncbi:hypothetical protein Dda_2971 [Drechslerella dactyloides]|uniref:Uncharacterized protein n=1 Tax=Drechslerella dactyloides TaxID=74499 RepID=A0AAD6NJW4_DREDA|nr:hypothetical protein Dda_2971 [Drechslerella dactyloides]
MIRAYRRVAMEFCHDRRALRPLDHNAILADPAVKIGPSQALAPYFNFPANPVRSRRDFEVYSDPQLDAADALHAKETLAGNRIKLCVGVDSGITDALRLSCQSGELNRRLLRDREEYLVRHPLDEQAARAVYERVREEVIDLLRGRFFHILWPFVLVFSCFEFTSHRRNFHHGHCLYLMVTVPSPAAQNCLDTLHKLVSDVVSRKEGTAVLQVVIQEIARPASGPLSDGESGSVRLLESNKGRHVPRNLDYHSRPPMGSSIGPAAHGVSGTLGGYVTTQSGAVYAVTASHAVGPAAEPVVSPSTVDLDGCHRQARAKEEIVLQELDFNLRTIGASSRESLESRRRWEIVQEELLVLSSVYTTPVSGAVSGSGTVSQLGHVCQKSEGAFYTSHEGSTIKSYLDLALVQCHNSRIGFNTIPCVRSSGSTTVLEVNAARSPVPGERVLKSGRPVRHAIYECALTAAPGSTCLTYGNVLSALAVVGYFEKEMIAVVGGDAVGEVHPQILQNWCITGGLSPNQDGIFASPGDSGAWILSDPQMPPNEESHGVLTVQTPVIGAIIHGFLSVEGVDLVMFQPWECMAAGFKQLLGEECVPLLPLSNHIALLREQQGPLDGCGICLEEGGVNHYIDECPERFRPEGSRSRFIREFNGIRPLREGEVVTDWRRLHQLSVPSPPPYSPQLHPAHSAVV